MIAIGVEAIQEIDQLIGERYRIEYGGSEILSDEFLWAINSIAGSGEFAALGKLAKTNVRLFEKMTRYGEDPWNENQYSVEVYTEELAKKLEKKWKRKLRQKIDVILIVSGKLLRILSNNKIIEKVHYSQESHWLKAYFSGESGNSLENDLQKIIDYLTIAKEEGAEYTYFFID